MRLKKILTSIVMVVTVSVCCACQQQTTVDYSAWVPDKPVSEIITEKEENVVDFEYRSGIDSLEFNSDDAIAEKLLNGDKEAFSMIYQNQLINGASIDLSENIDGKRTVMYISESEGNDVNNGLSPENPKKTLPQLSGFEDLAILLKAGDTFQMDGLFYVGTETIIGSYGEGPRPVLDFTKPIEESFVKVRGCENVWAVDLTKTEFNTETSMTDNCNFGQLYINGECNWKRLVVTAEECANYNFAQAIDTALEPCWAVDWFHSVLYIYSETDPNEAVIRVSSDKNGFDIKNANNVYVSDLEIFGVGAYGIKLSGSENVSITNCYIHNIGGALQAGGTVRYGNGIQIMSSAKNVNIQYNAIDWVYDTCYSTQGLSVTEHLNDISVCNNVFSNSGSAIFQVSDEGCLVASSGLLFKDNIFLNMIDVTNPNTSMYANSLGQPVEKDKDLTYVTYKQGATFASVQTAYLFTQSTADALTISGNVFWQTNRLLLRVNMDYEFPQMSDNLFYCVVDNNLSCLYAIYDTNTELTYINNLIPEGNIELIEINGEENVEGSSVSNTDARNRFGVNVKKLYNAK